MLHGFLPATCRSVKSEGFKVEKVRRREGEELETEVKVMRKIIYSCSLAPMISVSEALLPSAAVCIVRMHADAMNRGYS